jgi:hypothetical protein
MFLSCVSLIDSATNPALKLTAHFYYANKKLAHQINTLLSGKNRYNYDLKKEKKASEPER